MKASIPKGLLVFCFISVMYAACAGSFCGFYAAEKDFRV